MQVSSGTTAILLCQLVHCFGLSCSLFYTVHILQCILGYLVCAVHAGIACLAFLTYDWSQLHAGIACLASLVYDWAIACRDSLSISLHAGIVCLASLAYDWATACWDSMSILACWVSLSGLLPFDWLVTNGCF